MTGINPFDSDYTKRIALPNSVETPSKVGEAEQQQGNETNPEAAGALEKTNENERVDASSLVEDMDFSDMQNFNGNEDEQNMAQGMDMDFFNRKES